MAINDPRIKRSTGVETHNIFFQAKLRTAMDGSVKASSIIFLEEISVLDRMNRLHHQLPNDRMGSSDFCSSFAVSQSIRFKFSMPDRNPL